jgi:hypothetical protein
MMMIDDNACAQVLADGRGEFYRLPDVQRDRPAARAKLPRQAVRLLGKVVRGPNLRTHLGV